MLEVGVSFVIPVYNGEQSLSSLVEELARVGRALGKPFEVILVDDGSRDGSWQAIHRMVSENSAIRGFRLMRNYGQHNALLCGIRAARFDTVVTLDDDGQHPPEEVPRLIAKLSEGYEVVYGTPHQERHGLWRDLASVVTKLALQATMGAEVARKVSAFRVFRTEIREAFSAFRGPFASVDVLLTWGSTRFATIPVSLRSREKGTSNYTFRMLVIHALNMMTGFSALPLQLASLLGFAMTLFGFIILAWVVGRYLIQGASVPGFPFLASIIALFSGAQLFALGIIGEYLARMHFRMMERPTYALREVIPREEDQLNHASR